VCVVRKIGDAEFVLPAKCRYVVDDIVNFGAGEQWYEK
jgi:hypothetical protein